MSKLSLTTVLWYEGGEDNRPTVPSLALEGIESRFPSVRFPETGITFLYGHRNPGEAYLLRESASQGMTSALVAVPVEIGLWISSKLGFDPEDATRGVEHTGFMAMSRVKKDILEVVEGYWNRFIELGSPDSPFGGTRHANLMDGIVKLDKFKHLTAIAYTVNSEECGPFQVATVFKHEAIEAVSVGRLLEDVTIVGTKF
jgi:hypothetical protein